MRLPHYLQASTNAFKSFNCSSESYIISGCTERLQRTDDFSERWPPEHTVGRFCDDLNVLARVLYGLVMEGVDPDLGFTVDYFSGSNLFRS